MKYIQYALLGMILLPLSSISALAGTYYSGLEEQPVDFIDKKFKVTHTLGCIKPSQVSNTYTPIDLYHAGRQCFKENNPRDGLFLFKLAYIYGIFDAFRIINTEGGLEIQDFLGTGNHDKLDAAQKALYLKEVENFSTIRAANYCKEFKRLGKPTYKPDYMTQYAPWTVKGLIRKLFSESPHKIWNKMLWSYCVHSENEASRATAVCISPEEVTHKTTPEILYPSALQCFNEGKVDNGTFLFIVGNAYKKFDAQRVADEETAYKVEISFTNQFAELTPEQKTIYYKKLDEFSLLPGKKQALCNTLEGIGMPTYYPQYMMEDRNQTSGGLRSNVDLTQIWKNTVGDYCR